MSNTPTNPGLAYETDPYRPPVRRGNSGEIRSWPPVLAVTFCVHCAVFASWNIRGFTITSERAAVARHKAFSPISPVKRHLCILHDTQTD